eukprot:scaffold17266_cov78-Skeletonema_dohrnii-CCMP3373.AAC.3
MLRLSMFMGRAGKKPQRYRDRSHPHKLLLMRGIWDRRIWVGGCEGLLLSSGSEVDEEEEDEEEDEEGWVEREEEDEDDDDDEEEEGW